MSRILDISAKCVLVCGLALALFAPLGSAQATNFKVLHTFQRPPDGADPFGGLIADSAGNFYGTTQQGGDRRCNCGVVFKLAPGGSETVLHSFAGGRRGSFPVGGLIADSSGNLYGTTSQGGVTNPCHTGCGTVFEVTQAGKQRVLYSFKGGAGDGFSPEGNLIADSAGNLYGTTEDGGSGCGGGGGCGTVFKVAKDGTEAVLYSFCSQANCADGSVPFGGLIADNAGNLYGTTDQGGGTGCGGGGCGTVFKLAPDGAETVLYSFKGGMSDGSSPGGSLIADSAGNFYSTTVFGGSSGCNNAGCGTVFKLAPDGTETVLYSLRGGNDGARPVANLTVDSAGNLYSTTQAGGGTRCGDGCGTVFELAPDGTETVLYSFKGRNDGELPSAGLILANGNLYGTAPQGGASHFGTVFRLTP